MTKLLDVRPWEYLRANIPGAEFILLANVSQSAPIQRPMQFSASVLEYRGRIANTYRDELLVFHDAVPFLTRK